MCFSCFFDDPTAVGNLISGSFTNHHKHSDVEDSGDADDSCLVIDRAASEKHRKYAWDTIIWVFQRRATAGRGGVCPRKGHSVTTWNICRALFSWPLSSLCQSRPHVLPQSLHSAPQRTSPGFLFLWQALLVLWDSCSWPRKAGCVCFLYAPVLGYPTQFCGFKYHLHSNNSQFLSPVLSLFWWASDLYMC